MEVFSVVHPPILRLVVSDYFKSIPLNFLILFKHTTYDKLKDFPNAKIMVDSGAYYFNVWDESPSEDEIYDYLKKYVDFIKETKDDPRMVGYFDLDLTFLDIPHIQRIRKKLFKITNKIIPVYHPIWGPNVFKQMCNSYGYIGMSYVPDYKWDEYLPFVKYAHKSGCKLHALGMNKDTIMKKVPFNSCDSAIWVKKGTMEYYGNHNIPKEKKYNLKYRPIYLKRRLMIQNWRENYYRNLWKNYHNHQNYKAIGETAFS